ncbi:MAG: folate family ECF transporter S component, partial [Bacillota bacterium]
IAIFTGQIISSVILVPIFLNMLFEVPIKVSMIPKVVGEPVNVALYTYFIKLLSKKDLIKLDIINSSL